MKTKILQVFLIIFGVFFVCKVTWSHFVVYIFILLLFVIFTHLLYYLLVFITYLVQIKEFLYDQYDRK
jgi:hypothetical protein